MKKALLLTVVAVFFGIANSAYAATQTYSESFSFPLSPGSTTLNFPQFDDHGGAWHLIAVTMGLDMEMLAAVTAENDSAIPGNVALSFSGNAQGSGPAGLSTTILFNKLEGPVYLAPSDGIPDSGADFHDFGQILVSGSDMVSLTSPPDDLTAFIGLGNVNIGVNASGGFSLSGVSDSTLVISNFGAAGIARLQYEYVPEPVTALFGLSGFAMMAVRRRRAAA